MYDMSITAADIEKECKTYLFIIFYFEIKGFEHGESGGLLYIYIAVVRPEGTSIYVSIRSSRFYPFFSILSILLVNMTAADILSCTLWNTIQVSE
jgi:hypothetical protein